MAEHEAKAADFRERLDQLNLRLRAADADLRGEDGTVVMQAAALRRTLDEDWWSTANPEEIGGVWEHVRGWPDSTEKTGTTAVLQANIHRLYSVELAADVSGADTAAALYAALADRLREQARDEDGAAQTAQDTAGRLDGFEAPEVTAAERAHGTDRRAAAEQNRAAAAALETLADEEAASAVTVAAGIPAATIHAVGRRR